VTRDQQIAEALKLLDPPRGERAYWQARVKGALACVCDATVGIEADRVIRSKAGKKALRHHITVLRQALLLVPTASFAAMVKDEIATRESLLAKPPHLRRRPVNKTAEIAVALAWLLLSVRGIQPTVTRGREWDRLSGILLGDTGTDLLNMMRRFKRKRADAKAA
jgi:hypothetical protein